MSTTKPAHKPSSSTETTEEALEEMKRPRLQPLPDESHVSDNDRSQRSIHKAFPAAPPPGMTGSVQPPETL